MHQQWYFIQHGQVSGPHDVDWIKRLVAQGKIPKTIPIWPVGGTDSQAMPADEVMIFTELPDVQPAGDAAETRESASLESHELPPWLDDLRVWMGLEAYAAGKDRATKDDPSESSHTGAIPDWLEGWLAPGAKVPVEEKPMPAQIEEIPLAYPVKHPGPPRAVDHHTDKGIQETGFDPRTGRILDPHRFRRWKQEKSQLHPDSQELIDRDSMMEAFRSARTAIETWVNDDANRLRVLHADRTEIHENAQLKAIFEQFAQYGPTFRQRLEHHLELMVDQRRKANKQR
jgi:hypothetical protein